VVTGLEPPSVNALSRRFAAIGIALTIAAGAFSAPTAALAASTKSAPSVYAPAAAIVTSDGVVLWSRNADKTRRVASCIKMLNALVVRENTDLDDVITISRKAEAVDDGAVGLVAGQKYSVRQLLAVMLVHSANGAAEALGVGIAGNEKKYVAMMNAKAKSLGLKHTRAADPHGLSPKGYSTANDLSVIARELMLDPELREIVAQRSARLSRPNGGSSAYSTTDRMLGAYAGMLGIKTGYTDPAGYCFVGAAKRNGIELFGVVLGAEASGDRFTQMRALLDWGFKHAKPRKIVSRDATMGVVGVSGGTEPVITVRADQPLTLTVCDDGDSVTTQVSLPANVRAPVVAGQTIGAVQVAQGGVVVASVPLVADRSVACPLPKPTPVPVAATQAPGNPSVWQRIATVMAGFGRMLGI
jgi:serine-type D-Ala-D-Ala carboxypeptidase (penicillin-binding protein 5/6)